MKIAEALVRIKDLKGKLNDLQRVLNSESKFKQFDGSDPVPSIETEVLCYVSVAQELANLKTRVAKTNALHGLTDRINEMEQLKGIIGTLTTLTQIKQSVRTMESFNYGDPAIPMTVHATFNVEEVSAITEQKRDRIRELDLELQRLNWEVDLVK